MRKICFALLLALNLSLNIAPAGANFMTNPYNPNFHTIGPGGMRSSSAGEDYCDKDCEEGKAEFIRALKCAGIGGGMAAVLFQFVLWHFEKRARQMK